MEDQANQQETLEVVEDQNSDESPNQEVSERTAEQIEKLKKHNKELQEERDKYKSVFDATRPPQPQTPSTPSAQDYSHLNQDQVNNVFSGLIDENGYVDTNKLGYLLNDMNNRAIRAEQEAKAAREESRQSVRDFEESQAVRAAHAQFPELDPKSDKFNSDFFDSVTNEIIGQWRRGEKEDLMKAADKWHKRMFPRQESSEDKLKREQGQQARAVINTTPSRSAGRNQSSATEHADLVKRTRAGDTSALKERLEAIGQ